MEPTIEKIQEVESEGVNEGLEAQKPVIQEENERILEILETWLKNIQKIKKTLK